MVATIPAGVPWNKYAQDATHPDFKVRHQLDDITLAALFAWTEQQFNDRMAGSAIRRIGYERWSRNIAVALGNARRAVPASDARGAALQAALNARKDDPSALVREHVVWALAVPPAPPDAFSKKS